MLFLYTYVLLVLFSNFSSIFLYIVSFFTLSVLITYNNNSKEFIKNNFDVSTKILITYTSFKHHILFLINFLTKFNSIFNREGSLKWKPIFKKTSYFGLFRSNKNKWLNK